MTRLDNATSTIKIMALHAGAPGECVSLGHGRCVRNARGGAFSRTCNGRTPGVSSCKRPYAAE